MQLKRVAVLVAYGLGLLGFFVGLAGWGDAWLGLQVDVTLGLGGGLAPGEGESLYWARFVNRREGVVVFY